VGSDLVSCMMETIRCGLLTLPQLIHDCQPVFSSLRRTLGMILDVTPRLQYDLRRQFLSFPHNLPPVRTA